MATFAKAFRPEELAASLPLVVEQDEERRRRLVGFHPRGESDTAIDPKYMKQFGIFADFPKRGIKQDPQTFVCVNGKHRAI